MGGERCAAGREPTGAAGATGAQAMVYLSGCRDPLRGDREVVGKAPPLRETTLFRLTKARVFGEDQIAKSKIFPGSVPDMRPAPKAGFRVSGLSCPSKTRRQITPAQERAWLCSWPRASP